MPVKKCLFTIATGDFKEILEVASPTHEYFAELFGYEYKVFDEKDLERVGAGGIWNWRMKIVQSLSDDYEEIFYIDADTLFRRFVRDPFGEMYANSFQGLVLEHKDYRFNPNFGVWLVRSNRESAEFIQGCLDNGLETSRWDDQTVVCKMLGWSTSPFPGGFKPVAYSKYLENTTWLHPTWNHIEAVPYKIDNPHILHFAGSSFTHETRLKAMKDARDSLQSKTEVRLPWEPEGSTTGFRYQEHN